MKFFFKIYRGSWNGESTIALGFGISCGKALVTHNSFCPTMSGVRLALGLAICQVHLVVGTETKYDWQPITPGELVRLNPGLLK